MNLLAHALLSPPDSEILAGNLTADWVKGQARRALPEALQRGMALHQHIDRFTDAHPLVHRCSDLLAPTWRRYAPILVDIFFDHILSLDWALFCAAPREGVIAAAYRAVRSHMHVLPHRARYACLALLAHDWLSCYSTLAGIGLSLTRLSVRLRSSGHTVELAPAVADLAVHQPAFHAAFRDFFPQLQQHLEAIGLLPVHCPS